MLAGGNWTTFHSFSFFGHYLPSLLARSLVPKSCTHHLTHNNNNLLSHMRKKKKKMGRGARLPTSF